MPCAPLCLPEGGDLGSLFMFMGFESETRGSRRNKQPSPVQVRLTKEKGKYQNTFGVSFHQLTAEEGRHRSFQPWQLSSKRCCTPSFRPSDFPRTKRRTIEKKINTLILKKAQYVQTVTKIGGSRQANSNSKGPVPHMPCISLFSLSAHPSP